MEELKAKQSFRLWATLGFCALTLIWFLPWRFQTNDDELMMWLVSGAYTGEPEPYAVFIHPILSLFFSKLYTFFPLVSWYPLAWFTIILLSFWLIVKLIFKTEIQFSSAHITSALLLCLAIHFTMFLQFTLVAGFAGFAGLSWVVLNKKTSARNRDWMIAYFLICCSILIRFEAFVLVCFGLLFFLWISKSGVLRGKFITIIIILGISFLGYFSKIHWENRSPFAEFVSYNKVRAAVSDHPVTYRLNADEMIDSGSKWFFFSQWMMDDDSISTLDLEVRKKFLDAQLFELKQVKSGWKRLVSILRMEAFKSILIGIFVLAFFFTKIPFSKKLLFLAFWTIFFLSTNHLLILNGRVIILFIFPIVTGILLFPFEITLKMSRLVGAGLILLMGFHLMNFLKEGKGRNKMREEFLSLQKTIPKGSLMVLEGYKENYLGVNYSMLDPVPFLSFGWISKSPFQQKALDRFGLNSIVDAKSFFLFGVDVHEEFFFSDYMNFIGPGFELKEKTQDDNWILFHFVEVNPKD